MEENNNDNHDEEEMDASKIIRVDGVEDMVDMEDIGANLWNVCFDFLVKDGFPFMPWNFFNQF